MARANNGATDSVRIFPQAAASGFSGIELVTTNSSIVDWLMRSTAGPDKTACVAQAGNAHRSLAQQRFDALHKRSGRVDQVVHNQTILPMNIADDVHHFGYVHFRPPLIDNRQRRIQTFRKGASTLHAARVRRDNRQVPFPPRFKVVDHHGRSKQMINRDVEESLDLRCV